MKEVKYMGSRVNCWRKPVEYRQGRAAGQVSRLQLNGAHERS